MPEIHGRIYPCRCGHLDEEHRPGDPEPVCTVDGCWCGRNPLESARVVTCEWCSVEAPIVWCRTRKNSKPIPIEPEPNPLGNVEVVSAEHGVPLVVVHGSAPGMLDTWTPYMPHHATCDRKLAPPNQRK